MDDVRDNSVSLPTRWAGAEQGRVTWPPAT